MDEHNFESLRVWQSSRVLVNAVYDMMSDNKDWGFRDQIQRAAVSIMNNIAEGFESGSDAKFINCLNIAKGSCSEVRSMLYLCKDRSFCTPEQFEGLRQQALSLNNQLYRFIQYLNNKEK